MSDPELFHGGRVALYPGDCLATLDALPENSVDSVVCDPPYHLTSIVKRFGADGAAPAKHGSDGAFARASAGFMGKQWDGGDIAFRVETWAKVLRVLKPGGYLLAFSSSRTFGRMAVAIEESGFITHSMIGWVFASGFPKATRIKAPGYEGQRYGAQSLKPALEPIYMGQKPFSEATGTANILRWGTGAVRINDCRVGDEPITQHGRSDGPNRSMKNRNYGEPAGRAWNGRWPANLIHDGSPEVVALFPEAPGQQRSVGPEHGAKTSVRVFGDYGARDDFQPRGDSGSAARFFYQAKADSDDRLNSKHPTVKPLNLIRYLVRLVTPKGGLVLDCFAGTGTTGQAALVEGCRAILCERESEYCDDIRRRMALVYAGQEERRGRLAAQDADLGPLFAGGSA